ncbi:MAG: phage/plasmid primase, P4 family [Methanosarcinales archaeon]
MERVEDVKLFNHISSFFIDSTETKTAKKAKPEGAKINDGTLSKLNNILHKDEKLNNLFNGKIEDYESRSEAEISLYIRLLYYGFLDDEIYKILSNAKIGKWKTEKPTYKERTKINAHLKSNEYAGSKQEAVKGTGYYEKTDTGTAKRMYDLFGDNLLFCHKSKKWLCWDGRIWSEDNTGNIFRLAKKNVKSMHEYADSLPDGDTENDNGAEIKKKSDIKSKWKKFALLNGSTAKLKAVVENLQSENGVHVDMENMDLNKWILPVQNGTIDLKTGKLYESHRGDMCTKMIKLDYDVSANCPRWLKFINEILPDEDTQRYVKECLGSCLTGDTSEENMFIMYGIGSNGKSVLMDTVALLLGDFAVNIKASTLLTSNNIQSTPDNEIARLRGARLVTASEPKKGISLSDDVIKTITNSKAKITARLLYQEPFDFYPTHKTFFSSNHKPTVSDHSRGVWRRLRLIPFVTSIEDKDQDLNLGDSLVKELPGLLNWLVEGCLSWQRAGRLIMSSEVKRETDEYRADMDRLTEFLGIFTTKGRYEDKVKNMWLRNSYNVWADSMGFKPMNDKTFSASMSERDFKKVKSNNGYIHWRGLKPKITKIEDIDKALSGEDVEDKGGLGEDKALSGEDVEGFIDTSKRLNNNICSCDIEKHIEKDTFVKSSTSSLDGVLSSLDPPLTTTSSLKYEGLIKEIEIKLGKKYEGDNLSKIYGLIMADRHKQKGNNGNLKPIDDVNNYLDGLFTRVGELKYCKGQTKDIVNMIYENELKALVQS